VFDGKDLLGRRNDAMIAILLDCDLQRAEVAGFAVEQLQQLKSNG
jgi:hypothetical protein